MKRPIRTLDLLLNLFSESSVSLIRDFRSVGALKPVFIPVGVLRYRVLRLWWGVAVNKTDPPAQWVLGQNQDSTLHRPCPVAG